MPWQQCWGFLVLVILEIEIYNLPMRILGIVALSLVVSSCMPKVTDIIESQVPDVEDIKPEIPSDLKQALPPFK
jgi:hypothetical protein